MYTDGSLGRFMFKYRGKLMLPPMLFVLFWTRWELEHDLIVFGLGGLLFAAGLALRIWCQMHLHFRLRTAMAFTDSGPYACVRNPIYIANSTMLVGICVLSEVVVMAPVVLAWCAVVYTFVVRHEEGHLVELYGEPYRRYCERVSRWLPRPFAQASPAGFNPVSYLGASLAIEGWNVLLLVPFIAKKLIY